ncbi:MAG: MFS transporter [Spirochaetaceae bacterium]|nr:MAG: MFS transporter [Spirochaetaceae bacterium]
MYIRLPEADTRPVVLLGCAVAFSLLGDMTIYVILPVHHVALGFSPIQVGILLSANRWVRLVTNHVARHVLERRRASHVLALALCAGACSTLVYAAAPPFWLFLAARMVWGLCWSFIRHIGVMTSISVGRQQHAAAVLGLYTGVVQLGFIAGTLAGAVLFDAFNYSFTFLLVALVSLVGVAFDYAGFRLVPRAVSLFSANPDRTTHGTDRWMLLRSFIATCVSTGLIISTLGFALRSRFGESVTIGPFLIGITTLNGILIAAHYSVNSAGSPPVGVVIDRIGRRTAEIIGFSSGCAALIAVAAFGGFALLLPAVALFFVATVACKLSLFSQAGVAGSGHFAQLATAADLGAAAGPLIGWLAIERVGSAEAVFVIGAALYGIAALTALARPISGPR